MQARIVQLPPKWRSLASFRSRLLPSALPVARAGSTFVHLPRELLIISEAGDAVSVLLLLFPLRLSIVDS